MCEKSCNEREKKNKIVRFVNRLKTLGNVAVGAIEKKNKKICVPPGNLQIGHIVGKPVKLENKPIAATQVKRKVYVTWKTSLAELGVWMMPGQIVLKNNLKKKNKNLF